jgi:hypothetical protein
MSKRPSLASFSPKPIEANGGKVTATIQEAAPVAPAKAYPKISVYLDAQEVRTLKLIGVDKGQRISDICAVAIREWMERNGHSRGKLYKA